MRGGLARRPVGVGGIGQEGGRVACSDTQTLVETECDKVRVSDAEVAVGAEHGGLGNGHVIDQRSVRRAEIPHSTGEIVCDFDLAVDKGREGVRDLQPAIARSPDLESLAHVAVKAVGYAVLEIP